MAETVLSFVLDQLSIFLNEEGRLFGGLRQQVQLITDELVHMRAFLKLAEAKEDDDPRLQEWIEQVREAAYDTEDVLDDFVFRFARQRSKGFYGSAKRIFNSIKNLRAQHKVASIKKPKQQLISQLFEGDSEFKVISVVGMGGLGKTTLVKKVLEDVNVGRHFQIRAWVTVSQTFDFEELLISFIRHLHTEIKKPVPQFIKCKTRTSALKKFIKDFLQQGRYVVVFDDVWEMEFWNAIKFAMPDNSNGSRVLLTTRVMDVASASCKGFCGTFEDGCCPNHLKNVATVILDKCDGLPLAIVSISGLLAVKDVSRTDEWEMVRLGLGGELEGTGMNNEDVTRDYLKELANRSLIQVTAVFYEGVPRTCRIHGLLREVIISKCREQNMVTVTTGQHTRWPVKVRRLVIPNLYDNNSQESHCFAHLRSLITIGSTEPLPQTLFSELLSSKLLKVLNLRNTQLEEIPNEIFNLFHLNHLDLSRTRVKTVPKSIGKLQNLEYLNLRRTKVRKLPMEIKMLQKLSHLIIFGKYFNSNDDYYENCGFKTWARIGELVALQRLSFIDAATTENDDETNGVIKEIGNLIQLRDSGITNLRRKAGKKLCSSLDKLTNLQQLSVFSTGKNEEIDLDHSIPSSSSSFLRSLRFLVLFGCLKKMPQWITCLQGLVRIDLKWSGLRQDPLESLQHLPNLVQVSMSQAYQGEGLFFNAGGFLKLKELYLRDLIGLRWMRVEEGAMPRLEKLTLEEIPLLVELPLGIQHLKQLQKLELVDMSSQLENKLESEGGEDYQQIAHIPQFKANMLSSSSSIASVPQSSNSFVACLTLLSFWIVDSGASDHISGNKHLSTNLTTSTSLPCVTLVNGSKTIAKGIDQAQPLLSINLDSVLYVLGCPFNLVSISKFTHRCLSKCMVSFFDDSAFIYDQGTGRMIGTRPTTTENDDETSGIVRDRKAEPNEVIDLDYSISSSSISLQSLHLLVLRGRLEKMPQWDSVSSGLGKNSFELERVKAGSS
ncbi:hypothetical protein ACH5RR_040399 [Cinchona calisaya]|uniref:Disease resistance protein RPM1 n=1 Tax=Cinchona calisaya TaxID=153742 RepID=A0ABD2XRR7_9GENT